MDRSEGTSGGAEPPSKRHALAVLLIIFILIIATVAFMEAREPQEKFSRPRAEGYIIHPYYPDELSSYGGGPYPLSSPPNVRCSQAANVPPDSPLSEPYRADREPYRDVREPEGFAVTPSGAPPAEVAVKRGSLAMEGDSTRAWWPAAGFDDRWSPLEGEADRTIHTYRAGTTRPPLCDATPAEEWRYYGGSFGWTFSPYW